MTDLASNSRRAEPLPRFVVYSNGYAWIVADRLVPGSDEDGGQPEYTHGKRGRVVAQHLTREMAWEEADRRNAGC